MNKFRLLLLCTLCVLMSLKSEAAPDNFLDTTQSEIRVNPNIDMSIIDASTAIVYPDFVNLSDNYIQMNGCDWSLLSRYFNHPDSCPFTVVHIGDSHLQADVVTSVVRNRLGDCHGKLRGRGLIIPFRLAGTNQPSDYRFTTSCDVGQSRLVSRRTRTTTGFTGISIRPYRKSFDLNITTNELFDALIIYYTGIDLRLTTAENNGKSVPFYAHTGDCTLAIVFDKAYKEIKLRLNAPDGTDIHGINAEHGYTGLAYHVIGNNGAEFASYSNLKSFGGNISLLSPDLIIYSLGTNEAFGNFNSSTFRQQMDSLITEVKTANPRSFILLTTPSECQRRKGHRRNRRYTINENVSAARDAILQYGRDKSIPVYDWYKVSGGAGSSTKWLNNNLLSRDRIHMSNSGYRVYGGLLSDALIQVLCPDPTQIKK